MRRVLPAIMSLILTGPCLPLAAAAASQPDVNFKIYSPAPTDDGGNSAASGAETPVMDQTPDTPGSTAPAAESADGAATSKPAPAASTAPAAESADGAATSKPAPAASTAPAAESAGDAATSKPAPAATDAAAGMDSAAAPAAANKETPADTTSVETPAATSAQPAADAAADAGKTQGGAADGEKVANKILQGYIRVVPAHTKIPIIMDTAVDSDTSQEGDEFAARTGEDLTIDGQVVVPAGSVIKGRIAQLNAPRRLDRSGSVSLKFDTVTTPDNRQIPLVATIVARGGVMHARRGTKDIVLDAGIVTLPTLLGLGIGALAGGGSSANKVGGRAGAAVIGAAVGVAIGTVIICTKKGKKVDVRPGDELKIELGEDLRMPMGG